MFVPSPVQTTYNQYMTVAMNGMPASTSGWDADTRICESAPSGLGFGLAVSQSTLTDRGAVLGNLSGSTFVGITMADQTLANLETPGADLYQNYDNMAVLVRGDIWVVVGTNVAPNGAVYYNSVTGQLGASGITNAVQITGARWMTTATNGNLAVVRLGQTA